MTWARFRPELATEAARDQLTDAEFRLHIEASMWLYATEDDSLRVPRHMLGRISGADSPLDVAAGLVKRGWWRAAGEDWVIRHDANVFAESFAATRAKRRRDRHAQSRARQKRRPGPESSVTDSAADSATESESGVSADVSADLTTYLPTELPAPTGLATSSASGAQDSAQCVASGCVNPARRDCRTCWDHAYLDSWGAA